MAAFTRSCNNTYAALANAVNGTGVNGSPTGAPTTYGPKAANDTEITILATGNPATWGATDQLVIDNYITIKGQGLSNTTINSPNNNAGGAIHWKINAVQNPLSPTYQWGLQGFTFNLTNGGTVLDIEGNCSQLPTDPTGGAGFGGFHVIGESANFRMTDVKATSTVRAAILFRWSDIIGLVDHCIIDFLNQWGLVYNGKWGYSGINDYTGNNHPFAHGSYELPVKWGTAESLYFEDCQITNTNPSGLGGGCDSHEGGRYVTRHCRFFNGAKPTNHGTESHSHGCRAMEVYQNWFSGVDGSIGEHRSGTMICHDNVVQGSGSLQTYTQSNHRNYARKNQGSCRGENPTYMPDSRASVKYMYVNNVGGYAGGGTVGTMTVTTPNQTAPDAKGNAQQQVRIPVQGAFFKVQGESPVNTTHTIDSWVGGTIATQITFHPPLITAVSDQATIAFVYPTCDQNTPLANDQPVAEGNPLTAGTLTAATTTVPSNNNEPVNGNVSPDVYTGIAAAMTSNTAIMTVQGGVTGSPGNTYPWTAGQFVTYNAANYALNKGFTYELINTDDVQMEGVMITGNGTNTITVTTQGESGKDIGFAAGEHFAIRRVYAGIDQPGMGVIDVIDTNPPIDIPLSNTNQASRTVTTANVNSPAGSGRLIGWPNQKRDPNYNWNCWGNPSTGSQLGTGNGVPVRLSTSQGSLILGRDFFEVQKPKPLDPGVDPAISPGYPQDSNPGSSTDPDANPKRRIGAANISSISGNSTLRWPVGIQTGATVTGLIYPHPMIIPPVLPPGPLIVVAPDSDAFSPPAVTVGTSVDHQNLVISNGGDSPLTINGIASSSARFTIGTGTGGSYVTPITFPFTINVGGSITKTVRFTPLAATSYSTTITFDSNDTATHESAESYIITGTGQTAPQGPIMSLSTPSHPFGTVTVGQAASFTVTITNSGDQDLIVSSITLPSAPNNMFTIGVGQSTNFTITAGNNTTRDIVFTPAAATSYSGTIAFVSNDPDTLLGRENFTVTGTGQNPVTPPPGPGHGKKKNKNTLIRRF